MTGTAEWCLGGCSNAEEALVVDKLNSTVELALAVAACVQRIMQSCTCVSEVHSERTVVSEGEGGNQEQTHLRFVIERDPAPFLLARLLTCRQCQVLGTILGMRQSGYGTGYNMLRGTAQRSGEMVAGAERDDRS